MKDKKDFVTIIVSAKNEAGGIGEIVASIKKYGDEVIVVDGHSKDKTREIARQTGAKVFLDHGRGKGDAMRVGVEKAKGKIIVFFDADGSHEQADISKMTELLKKDEADFVIASRRTGGSHDVQINFTGMIRATGADFLTMLVNRRFKTNLTDILYSFRAIKKDVFRDLKLDADAFEIEQEMVVRSLKKRYRLVEIPSREKTRGWGKSKLKTSTGLKFLVHLLRELMF